MASGGSVPTRSQSSTWIAPGQASCRYVRGIGAVLPPWSLPFLLGRGLGVVIGNPSRRWPLCEFLMKPDPVGVAAWLLHIV